MQKITTFLTFDSLHQMSTIEIESLPDRDDLPETYVQLRSHGDFPEPPFEQSFGWWSISKTTRATGSPSSLATRDEQRSRKGTQHRWIRGPTGVSSV